MGTLAVDEAAAMKTQSRRNHKVLKFREARTLYAYLRIRGAYAEVTERHKADYILVGWVGKRKNNRAPCWASTCANGLKSVLYRDCMAYYATVDTYITTLPYPLKYRVAYGMGGLYDYLGYTSVPAILGRILGCNEHDTANSNMVIRQFYSRAFKVVKERKACDYWRPTKISGPHLRYVTINDLLEIVNVHDLRLVTRVLNFVNNCNEATEAFVVGVILYALQLDDQMRSMWLSSDILDGDVMNYYNRCKQITIFVKALQNNICLDLTPFFEMETLVNRGTGSMDWAKEKRNRTQLNVINMTGSEAYQQAVRLFSECRVDGGLPMVMDYKKYWQTRWEWTPPGSVHSQYESDLQYIPDVREVKNKKIFLLSMPNELPYEHWYSRTPENCAWPSVKYEWGKQRAIYGSDITNFVMSNLGLLGCENVFDSRFPVGANAVEAGVRKRVQHVLAHSTQYCLDFEDFNSQHSIEVMSAVIMAYRDVYGDVLSKDQILALNWTVDSVREQYVMRPGTTDREYKLKGTLFSGWRLTSFMNTVCNYIYLSEPIRKMKLLSLHNGDDVLIGVDTVGQVITMMKHAVKYNCRLAPHKCYLAGVREFLRIDHRRSGKGGQYLSRAVSTLVHGRTESMLPNSVVALVKSYDTRLSEIFERNASNIELGLRIRNRLDKFTADKWSIPLDQIRHLRSAHITQGGLCETMRGDVTINYEEVTMPPKRYEHGEIESIKNDIKNRRLSEAELKSARGTIKKHEAQQRTEKCKKIIDAAPGIHDYARYVTNLIGDTRLSVKTVTSHIRSATKQSLHIEKRHLRATTNAQLSMPKFWRNMYRAYRDLFRIPRKYMELVRFGIPPTVLNNEPEEVKMFVAILTGYRDKMKCLSMCF